ncbi:hypothetical protein BD94_2756 [Elizabethkingia anophelis NUHP1]|uniref:Uncharacterized protein n=1 Tax=Elizabethkingia anophelis NUHP1 TaxID=1338011 RepID=A0A077EFX2_9FLAO|nr:hypothetical protein BD94_2756 [Elizabethkingia anophelis NUHP1]BBQ05958.1 hypothetical protein JUNP353_0529 [Elizabethkingia anophelis]
MITMASAIVKADELPVKLVALLAKVSKKVLNFIADIDYSFNKYIVAIYLKLNA